MKGFRYPRSEAQSIIPGAVRCAALGTGVAESGLVASTPYSPVYHRAYRGTFPHGWGASAPHSLSW